jgi:hypothetical protein
MVRGGGIFLGVVLSLSTDPSSVGLSLQPQCFFTTGSHTECKYALMTFGIPVSLIPLDDHGRLNMDGFLHMMAELRRSEEELNNHVRQEGACGRILFPSANDVLLGRGRPYRKFVLVLLAVLVNSSLFPDLTATCFPFLLFVPKEDFHGNQILADIVEEHRSEYKSQGKLNKSYYADKVVGIIKETFNGRFLKKVLSSDQEPAALPVGSLSKEERKETGAKNNMNDDTSMEQSAFHWVEVDDVLARDKVCHSFRTKKQTTRTAARRDSSSSSSTTKTVLWGRSRALRPSLGEEKERNEDSIRSGKMSLMELDEDDDPAFSSSPESAELGGMNTMAEITRTTTSLTEPPSPAAKRSKRGDKRGTSPPTANSSHEDNMID